MSHHGAIRITRELYPAEQRPLNEHEAKLLENRLNRLYAAPDGGAMIEMRFVDRTTELWRSEDHGTTWRHTETIPCFDDLGHGRRMSRGIGYFADPDNGRLVRFIHETMFTSKALNAAYYGASEGDQVATLIYYQVSTDSGLTWEPKRQFIQNGPEYNSEYWAKDVYHKKSALYLGIPSKLKDGTIILPFQGDGDLPEKETYGSIQGGFFRGRWKKDLSGIDWDMAGKVYGGGCEQTVAELDDGRIFVILRAQGLIDPYPFPGNFRPYAVSDDAGQTWSKPRPLTYTDGSLFSSPWAWSRLIKSSKNGKWYWIANILPNVEGIKRTCDPRHPLQIAELDTETLAIKKETVTVIEDKSPADPDLVRFSNFCIYEDRRTQDLILLMMKSYSELTPNWLALPRPNYLYRITL